ncbi:MAG: hypothetical protein ACI9UR_001884 [Bacteroidia bacterium]|jgi:hypothetical protein
MKLVTILLFFLLSLSIIAQNFTADVEDLLIKRTSNGLVDYKTVKANPEQLNAILKQIANAPQYKSETEKAFLINAYNVFVIKGVVDHYPVEGPLKIDGFFDKKTFKFRGKQVTLNDVEKGMLYKAFPDARLHFVLVCAAIGCPKLASYAYSADKLEAELDEQTKAVINDPTFIRLDGPNAKLSEIFDWYAADFGGKEEVIPFIQKHLLKKIKLNPKYSFYEYDWSLNELK